MAAAAPTGCFKCGRPGHWSRDCPSAPPASADQTTNPSRFASSYPNAKPRPPPAEGDASAENKNKKRKKERATRPKLTPDLLLSDDGIGFVLRYFPKAFKPRARPGHEVEDLGNLIKLYTDWHSRLIPYYSFEQFVRKLEKVGATNRVRRCISELRDRVARGGDPTVLHEAPVEEVTPAGEPDGTAPEDPFLGTEDNHATGPAHKDLMDPPMDSNDVDLMQEDLLDEIYEKAADDPRIPSGEGSNKEASEPLAPKEASSHDAAAGKTQKQQDGASSSKRAKIELTEEQRARMEANRLKALERAAARARASQSHAT
ncbi:hypothetical protein PAHAL_4G003800 [Panicum hallii]|uniref:CCHC-type domain-containing protein n=1 Tax=Panicum hallii TaxID=206008 RepID=A0A2S3HG14_9POAL|nr:TIMELESS-interacting protein [Panicum hallii]PAN22207.1 hypothetical protein PAHAL_4G003800 [Panicum hallii]